MKRLLIVTSLVFVLMGLPGSSGLSADTTAKIKLADYALKARCLAQCTKELDDCRNNCADLSGEVKSDCQSSCEDQFHQCADACSGN